MTQLAKTLRNFRSRFWRALRALSGDDAYERYLEHALRHHPDETPMSAAVFYRLEQERRWGSGPNRCC